jgi:hypothetical protein
LVGSNTVVGTGAALDASFSAGRFFGGGDFLGLDDVDLAVAFALLTLPDGVASALLLFATAQFLPAYCFSQRESVFNFLGEKFNF